jgi:diadenosine tetraphosphate (Ap4A) HIT family hydrolase
MEEHRHEGNAVTVLTARVPDPAGYGRIIRDAGGSFEAITEDKDLSPDQRRIDEINSGIYAFRTPDLLESLGHLRDDNQQGELYLTDTISHLRRRGERVGTYTLADPMEISGINTPAQLAAAEALLEKRRRTGTLDCPICDLAGRGDDFPVLSRTARAILVVTARPYNSGQIAAHPLRHVLRHSDLDAVERRELWILGEIGAATVETLYHPQGMNIGYNSGIPGEHLGLQVIPRWIGDANFLPLLADVTLLPESLETTYRRVREALGAQGTVR